MCRYNHFAGRQFRSKLFCWIILTMWSARSISSKLLKLARILLLSRSPWKATVLLSACSKKDYYNSLAESLHITRIKIFFLTSLPACINGLHLLDFQQMGVLRVVSLLWFDRNMANIVETVDGKNIRAVLSWIRTRFCLPRTGYSGHAPRNCHLHCHR